MWYASHHCRVQAHAGGGRHGDLLAVLVRTAVTPSRSVATSQAGAGCVLRVSASRSLHTYGCNPGGVAATLMAARRAATNFSAVVCSVKCVLLLFLPWATPTAQRTPTLRAWIVRPTVTAAHPVSVRYWFPLVHFISLTFKPTPLIGLNASLKMPVATAPGVEYWQSIARRPQRRRV
jgi:hypothetical protein